MRASQPGLLKSPPRRFLRHQYRLALVKVLATRRTCIGSCIWDRHHSRVIAESRNASPLHRAMPALRIRRGQRAAAVFTVHAPMLRSPPAFGPRSVSPPPQSSDQRRSRRYPMQPPNKKRQRPQPLAFSMVLIAGDALWVRASACFGYKATCNSRVCRPDSTMAAICSSTNKMTGDRSTPPTSGTILRKGRSRGAVSW